jgi:soluble lytic murein transglycosylase-like protein
MANSMPAQLRYVFLFALLTFSALLSTTPHFVANASLSQTLVTPIPSETYYPEVIETAKPEPKLEERMSSVVSYIQKNNSMVDKQQALLISNALYKAAHEFDLDPRLLLALVKVESNFEQDSVGSLGASRGLVQVIPKWHRDKIVEGRKKFGVYSVFDVQLNAWLGAKILDEYKDSQKTLTKALIRYNASTNAVAYADKVLSEYRRVKEQIPAKL